jgi:hypothetical protein
MTTPDTQSAGISIAMVIAFGIQQGVEVIDSVVTGFGWIGTATTALSRKKAVLKVVSIIAGWGCAQFMGVDVLTGTSVPPGWIHTLVTALALAGGTEGVNSALKYAAYAKENKKNDAAAKLPRPPESDQNLKVINNK